MKRSARILTVGAIAGAAFAAGAIVAPLQAGGDPSGDEAAMQKAWEHYMTPGPEHAQMAKHAGEWDVKSTFWQYPGADPTTSKLRAEIKPAFNGLFLIEKVSGNVDFGDGQLMPMQGMNIIGYDNAREMYVYSWVDNMSSGIYRGEGEASPDGKVVTYNGWGTDPMTGGIKKNKSVATELNENKMKFEMHEPLPDGTMFKVFEMVYTRAD